MPERNKVIFNGTTLIDLTDDSVSPELLAFGATAHDKSGASIVGTAYKNNYYVKGTQTSKTNNWTGNLLEVDALYNGLAIDYWLPFDGSGNATLNLTLKNGTNTGNINCYISGTDRLSKEIPANSIIHLIYQTVTISGTSYTGWWNVVSANGIDSGWQSYNDKTVFTGSILYRKVGSCFMIVGQQIKLVNTLNAGAYVILMELPLEYVPSKEIMPNCFMNNNIVNNRIVPMRLTYNGKLYLYANKTDSIESTYSLYFSGFGFS